MTQLIDLELVYPNPNQPRKTFDETKLHELAASILENGLKQPITVRLDGKGRFMIVMGERRYRAHKILQEMGEISEIECQLSDADDRQLDIDAIIENDQRVDVHPFEQAMSYQRMLNEHKVSPEQLAKMIGKPLRRITERLELLKMDDAARALFRAGQINPTQAWYIAQLSSRGQSSLIKAINLGHCPSNAALAAVFDKIKNEESQVVMFELCANTPTKEERKAARKFEDHVEQLAALLRSGIDDNEVTAAAKVNPDKAGLLADVMSAMQIDLRRIEASLRASIATKDIAA